MYNLFIVRSPLQFINAIEAKFHFKTTNNILYMIHNKSTINSAHMRKIFSFSEWDEIIEINSENKKNSLINNVKSIKILKEKKYNYIFTGDIGNINTVLISSLTKNETYLLDDGTMTLVSHQTLNPNEKKPWSTSRFIKNSRYNFFGLKCNLKKERINYFTIFDINPHKDEKIVKNKFSFFKQSFLPQLKQDSNTVYFIGQNLIVENIMSEVIYLQYIKNIIKYYSNQTIIYYPHRFEKISEKYRELEGKKFIIKESTQPIEVELLTRGYYPTYIASFVSSALSSLKNIFQNANIDSFVIQEKDLLSHKENFKLIYAKQNPEIHQVYLNIYQETK